MTNGGGTTFRARVGLRFTSASSLGLINVTPTTRIPIPNTAFELAQFPEGAAGERDLFVDGGPFGSADEAVRLGHLARAAVLAACAESRLPADVGQVRADNQGHAIAPIVDQNGVSVQVPDFVPGITVYRGDMAVRWFALGDVQVAIGTPPQAFAQSVGRCLQRGTQVLDPVVLALETFVTALMIPMPAPRLLALVSSIEALAVPRAQPPNVIAVVDDLLGVVDRSGLVGQDKDRIITQVKFLREESRRQACRRVVGQMAPGGTYEGQPALDFLETCYGVRSDLTHGRPLSASVDLRSINNGAMELCRDLLLAVTR